MWWHCHTTTYYDMLADVIAMREIGVAVNPRESSITAVYGYTGKPHTLLIIWSWGYKMCYTFSPANVDAMMKKSHGKLRARYHTEVSQFMTMFNNWRHPKLPQENEKFSNIFTILGLEPHRLGFVLWERMLWWWKFNFVTWEHPTLLYILSNIVCAPSVCEPYTSVLIESFLGYYMLLNSCLYAIYYSSQFHFGLTTFFSQYLQNELSPGERRENSSKVPFLCTILSGSFPKETFPTRCEVFCQARMHLNILVSDTMKIQPIFPTTPT